MTKAVHLVIVTFNRIERTKPSLHSIRSNTAYPYILTVIDNNSDDGSREWLLEQRDKGAIDNLLLLDRNYGLSAAANAGWDLVDTPYYLRMDNDIVVARTGWLKKMIEIVDAAQNSDFGALSYDFFQHENRRTSQTRIASDTKVSTPANQSEIYGGAVMIRKEIFRKFGYWCTDYGQYSWEDTDYGVRLTFGGYNNHFFPETGWLLHEGAADPIDYDQYMQFKKRKYESMSSVAGANLLLYALKLRPLFMRRRYRTVIDPDGVHARLIPDSSYDGQEGKTLREFMRFLKAEGIQPNFPRGADDARRFADTCHLIRQKLNLT